MTDQAAAGVGVLVSDLDAPGVPDRLPGIIRSSLPRTEEIRSVGRNYLSLGSIARFPERNM
ncbi:protein of unknown function [Methanoculleus bourgensis]|uniref:Uncharacterized protein n=1 Tax=Methanoculleus bourgensis TaxID=83986 RepID=A0A0X3BPD8_9EURY|nr:protein of unknown function [Methanoculleus bourgensis]